MARGNFGANLARRTLAAAQRGGNVPRDVQDAAKRVYGGVGGEGDVATLATFWGVRRSGATAVRRTTRGLTAAAQSVTGYATALNDLAIAQERGAGMAAAQARLVGMFTQHAEAFFRSKGAKNVASELARLMGGNGKFGRDLMGSLGRGFRLAGAVGQIALTAYSIAEDVVSGRKRLADATANIKDVNKTYGDPTYARKLESQIRKHVEAKNILSPLTNMLPKGSLLGDYAQSFIEEEVAQRVAERGVLQEKARSNIVELGLSKEGALAAQAKKLGISMHHLDDREIREALDTGLAAKLQGLGNTPGAKAFIDAELAKRGYLQQFLDAAMDTKGGLQVKRRELGEEYVRKFVDAAAQKAVDRKLQARRTPAERVKIAREQNFLRQSSDAYRSRHATWNPD